MATVEELVVDGLPRQDGFNDYFADITYARDAIDPPIRRNRRQHADLSLTVNPDEYDIVGGVDLMDEKLTLAFGVAGLIEVAECFTEAFVDPEDEPEADIVFNGVRFALLFQSAQVFATNRMLIDRDFLDRVKTALPLDRTSQVIYDRKPFCYPDTVARLAADSALHYRGARLSSRIALDRITAAPYGRTMRSHEEPGLRIINAMRAKLDSEVEAGHIEIDAAQRPLTIADALTALHGSYMSDLYPLTWSALANPAEQGLLGELALAHIGQKRSNRAGWVAVSDVIDRG